METNIPILNEFLYYLLCVRNYSKQTAIGYSRDLRRFFRFIINYLELNIKPKDINVFVLGKIEESTIIQFLIYLNYYENNSPSTRGRIITSIKSFYKWLFYKYSVTLKNKHNPTLNIPSIDKIERLPKYIRLKDAKRIESIFNENNSRFYERNNAIMVLFLNTGLRVSELISINKDDIDFINKKVKVIGKGNKERTVYLNNICIDTINNYLKTRDDEEKALFINSKKQRFKIRGVEEICEKAFKLSNLETFNYTTHTLRHTAATYLYKSSHDILVVKEFLGHSSLNSTEIYTHIMPEILKDAVNKNPLNEWATKKGGKNHNKVQ